MSGLLEKWCVKIIYQLYNPSAAILLDGWKPTVSLCYARRRLKRVPFPPFSLTVIDDVLKRSGEGLGGGIELLPENC